MNIRFCFVKVKMAICVTVTLVSILEIGTVKVKLGNNIDDRQSENCLYRRTFRLYKAKRLYKARCVSVSSLPRCQLLAHGLNCRANRIPRSDRSACVCLHARLFGKPASVSTFSFIAQSSPIPFLFTLSTFMCFTL